MTMRYLAMLALFLAAQSAFAGQQTVAAARVVEVAREALLAQPVEPDTRLELQVVGQPADIALPSGAVEMRAQQPAGRWPRSRVAVPVQVQVGQAQKTVTVWFAVKATRELTVYAVDAVQGTGFESLQTRQGDADVAQLQGHPVDATAAMKDRRLRRAMLAGLPVLEEDFEPVPDVDTRQQVTVLVRYGAIHVQTSGTALGKGGVGEMVAVLAAGADSPVQAKVTGKGVVEVAR